MVRHQGLQWYDIGRYDTSLYIQADPVYSRIVYLIAGIADLDYAAALLLISDIKKESMDIVYLFLFYRHIIVGRRKKINISFPTSTCSCSIADADRFNC